MKTHAGAPEDLVSRQRALREAVHDEMSAV
jgi:hypothetical protein